MPVDPDPQTQHAIDQLRRAVEAEQAPPTQPPDLVTRAEAPVEPRRQEG